MRVLPCYVLTSLFALMLMIFSNCKKNDTQPTEEERITKLLTSGQWLPATGNWVVADGQSVAELFVDFKITFTETGYTTAGTTPVWPRTGTCKFKTGSTQILIRDADQVEGTIQNLDDKNLKRML